MESVVAFSNVCGNWAALNALVETQDFASASLRICVGSLLGFVPSHDECIRLAKHHCIDCVMGIAEGLLSGQYQQFRVSSIYYKNLLFSQTDTYDKFSDEWETLFPLSVTQDDIWYAHFIDNWVSLSEQYTSAVLNELISTMPLKRNMCGAGMSARKSLFIDSEDSSLVRVTPPDGLYWSTADAVKQAISLPPLFSGDAPGILNYVTIDENGVFLKTANYDPSLMIELLQDAGEAGKYFAKSYFANLVQNND